VHEEKSPDAKDGGEPYKEKKGGEGGKRREEADGKERKEKQSLGISEKVVPTQEGFRSRGQA